MTLPIWKPAAGLLAVAIGGLIVWTESYTLPGRTASVAICASEPEETKAPPEAVPPSAPPTPPSFAAPTPPSFSMPAATPPSAPPEPKEPAFGNPVGVPPTVSKPPSPPPLTAEMSRRLMETEVPPPPSPEAHPKPVTLLNDPPTKPLPPSPAPVQTVVTPPVTQAPVLAAPVVTASPMAATSTALPPPMITPSPADTVKPAGFSGTATTTVITSAPIVSAGGVPACQLSLKVGNGLPHFEIRSGDELLLKAKCERVDMQSSPDSNRKFLGLQATGKVQVSGSGISGTCEQMTVQSLGGEVTLKGNVHVTFRKGSHVTEMIADQMTFQVSNKGLTTTSVTTATPTAPVPGPSAGPPR